MLRRLRVENFHRSSSRIAALARARRHFRLDRIRGGGDTAKNGTRPVFRKPNRTPGRILSPSPRFNQRKINRAATPGIEGASAGHFNLKTHCRTTRLFGAAIVRVGLNTLCGRNYRQRRSEHSRIRHIQTEEGLRRCWRWTVI